VGAVGLWGPSVFKGEVQSLWGKVLLSGIAGG
jgi:hypothetical protein